MPKMKTKKSAAKRFIVKKSVIKRGSAFRSHILTKKSRKTKRALRSSKYVHSSDLSNVKRMLGI